MGQKIILETDLWNSNYKKMEKEKILHSTCLVLVEQVLYANEVDYGWMLYLMS